MTLLTRLLAKLAAPAAPVAAPPEPQRVEGLIDRIDIVVDARCPCGSPIVHHLRLQDHADCPRCSRTFAVRSIMYYRPSPHQLPDAQVTIGFVLIPDRLHAMPAVGVVQ